MLGGGSVDTTGLVAAGRQRAGPGQWRERPGDPLQHRGAIEQYDDCYLVKVYNEINEVWDAEFGRAGETYEQPALVFFTQAVSTGCGQASSQVGPFYCPPDQSIFIDIGFLDQLQQQFGAEGRYAQAYILAHEVRPPPARRCSAPSGRCGRPSSRTRASRTSSRSRWSCRPTATPVSGASWPTTRGTSRSARPRSSRRQDAAAAVGDDRIQQQTQGRVDKESWTHGSAEQPASSGSRPGATTGDVNACDTFKGLDQAPARAVAVTG